jgi:hypothetical protein
MRSLFFILTTFVSVNILFGQTADRQVNIDTMIYSSRECKDCPVILDTVVYKLLNCGLYLGSNGDLGYRTEAIYNENFDMQTRYLTWIYGADQTDTLNGGLKEMKFIIDTVTFQFLSFLYWADKNNIYGFNPMSDGGTAYLNDRIDRKTFNVLGDTGYAKDKTNVYYRGMVIEGADLKTFRIIEHKEIPELAYDKLYFYQNGHKMTEKEVKANKLENYIKQTSR